MADKAISARQQPPSARPPWQHCAVILIVGLIGYFLLPDQLALMARIAIMALFVLSLDLIVGYAGLATLGHVAFFGVGAYAAGIVALKLTGEPLIGLAFGGIAGALTAGLSGLLVLRYEGFTFLMLTVAVAQILQNMANKLRNITGGDDGLSGFTTDPILGMAAFDMEGRVAYIYTFAVLILSYYVIKRLVDSPFGLSVLGIHQCRARMAALGTAVPRQLWKMYVAAGFFAGVAGAMVAQTNAIVGLDSLGFTLSAEALVMLILGGAGRLYGALIGAVIFMALHHTASSINPYHWLFVIGGLLMIVVLVPRKRLQLWLMPDWLVRLFSRSVKTGEAR
jgi:branched-chain amino acid transport system permease protein